MSASEHLLSRIRAHIPAGYWRVLSVYRVAHGGATSAAVRRPVCSLPMVVTGSLALGMDGGGHRTRWAAARTGNSWASAAALAASRRVDAGCSSCAPGCCPARRSPSGRVGSRPPGPDQGALARAPTRPAPSALPCSAFAAPARTALRACAPLAIFTVPACSLGRRATAETASAADAGPGGRGCTRARESSRLVLLRRLGGVRGRRRSRVARRRRRFRCRRRRHGNRRSPRHCPRRLPSRRHRRPCRRGLSRPRWSTPRLGTAATAATVQFQRSPVATAVTTAAAATPAAIFAAIADAAERGGV